MEHEGSERKALIALVDDSAVTHQVVKRALEPRFQVASFYSGEEALAGLGKISAQLLLLDVEMPGIDGFETLGRLQSMPELAGLPVVFLTARSDVSFEIRALSQGAADYISKPFAGELLERRVALHLSHHNSQQQLQHYNEDLQGLVQQQVHVIKELQHALIFTLADLVEMRDNFTGKHVLRTQDYYGLLVDYLTRKGLYADELSQLDCDMLLEASQLHDIGKIAIPDAVLLKPGRLTPEEFELMKTHTIVGYNAICKAMHFTADKEFLQYAATIALNHHEKWDGSGYPNRLKGTDIPLIGRIMAVVDVYDALVSDRHYKSKMPHDKAVRILADSNGTHFDPVLMRAFLGVERQFQKVGTP